MSSPLSIAFIWHMHQPYYRDLASGSCSMPWVRLHATKDYLDMVTRLDAFPAIHQTFNLVPSLLDQLEEYLPPASRSDVFLDLSRKPAAALDESERRFLLEWFFLANPERMIRPHPRYADLLAKRGARLQAGLPAAPTGQIGGAAQAGRWPQLLKRFSTQDFLDLQVWFNLVWIDPWLRRQHPRLAALEAKGERFSEDEKRVVLDAHLELIGRVIPAYREAHARGAIELTTSPYYHPILPLLCDLREAKMALPDLPLPEAGYRHPEDARWQLQQAIARHRQAFGTLPKGLWPPEGSVSEAAIALAIEAGIGWLATDEGILWRTLKSPRNPSLLYRPHLVQRSQGRVAMVFRDRELSDLIGFTYSRWDARQAVEDFLKRLASIHHRMAGRPALVPVILDGENAWESYPDDGHEFLTALYGALAHDARFRCVTVSEFLERHPPDPAESLPPLFSGSWIDANFATWAGHPEKNAAWTRLAEARHALEGRAQDDPSLQGAWRSFGAAEGSDWMWWFGDTHVSAQAEEFDRLFRLHLANGYQLAGVPIPDALKKPIRRPPSSVTEPPTALLHPTIDGRETSYYEWLFAGAIRLQHQSGAIQRSEQHLRGLRYGFDQTHHYLRLDFDPAFLTRRQPWGLLVSYAPDVSVRIEPAWPQELASGSLVLQVDLTGPVHAPVSAACARICEVAIPLAALGPSEQGRPLQLAVTLLEDGQPHEHYPEHGFFTLAPASAEREAHGWSI